MLVCSFPFRASCSARRTFAPMSMLLSAATWRELQRPLQANFRESLFYALERTGVRGEVVRLSPLGLRPLCPHPPRPSARSLRRSEDRRPVAVLLAVEAVALHLGY